MTKKEYEIAIRKDVGKNLLQAMKCIDTSIAHLTQRLYTKYGIEAEQLIKIKRELKTILNREFDELAIQNKP